MAIVGEAYVVVKAISSGVEKDIRKVFSGATSSAEKAGSDMGDAVSKGFNKSTKGIKVSTLSSRFKETLGNSVDLADGFTSLTRKGYAAQAGMGALAGSLGSLVGGLGALVGSAGAASGALAAVAGSVTTLKVGLAVGKLALGGISQAVSAATKANGGYSKSLKQIKFDAEEAALSQDRAALNLEKARETMLRTQDLPSGNRTRREAEIAYQEALLAYKRAKEAKKAGGKDDTKSGSDPYAGLTESQKTFAKYLAGLKKDFDALKEAAAKGFLPLLQEQMQRLIKAGVLDILKKRFFDIGQGLGKAAEKFTDVFLSGDNLKNFDIVLKNIAETLPKFGTILGNVFSGFLTVLKAADPLTRRFVSFLEAKSGSLAKFLSLKDQVGPDGAPSELTTFFNKAGDVAAKFGKIFGNVFGGLGKIIQANFAPGSGGWMILDWLDKVTAGWKNMDLMGLESYFKGAADNFITMAETLGGAIESIIKAGSDPAIKEFWTALDAGSYAFNEIVKGSVKSAPALGRLLKTLTEIVAVFTDDKQVTAFFDTLNFFAGGIREALLALKPLIDIVGPIFAVVSAIGLLEGAIFKVTAVMVGFGLKSLASIAQVATAVGVQLPAALLKLIPAATASGTAMTLALGPVGIAIAAIVAAGVGLVAVFAGIHGAQMEKAAKGVAQAFKEGANSADTWSQAILAVGDGSAKNSIDTLDEMKSKLVDLNKVQTWAWDAPGFFSDTREETTALADSFGAMGRSLANTATTDLVSAQTSFRNFRNGAKLTNAELRIGLDEMDEYKTALIDQADQIGINIRTKQGDIDMTKLTNFAVGEGEIAVRNANMARAKFNETIAETAKNSIDATGPLKQSAKDTLQWAKDQAAATEDAGDSWKDYYDGQGFSMDKYLDDLEKQAKATTDWQINMKKVTLVASDGVKTFLNNLGLAGADVVAGLTDGVNDAADLARLEKLYGDAGTSAGKGWSNAFYVATKNAKPGQLFANVGVPRSNQKDGGFIGKYALGGFVSGAGTARSDSIPAMLSNGEYVINARATAQNRQLLDAINSNKNVGNSLAPNVSIVVNPSPGMDERELAEIVSRKIAFEMRKGRY